MSQPERIYRESEWEHGLMCAECPHLFTEGEAFSERLEAFQDDVPILVIVCVPCALKDAVSWKVER